MIKKFTFTAPKDGPHIVFTGCVHGNEPCGKIALSQLMQDIESGDVTLNKGSLTLMPCCNQGAFDKNLRFVDVNLNRIMSEHLVNEYLESHEASLVPLIMEGINKADYFIDLHSFTENMAPVVICIDDQNKKARALAEACGIKRIECDSPFITKPQAQMTLHYARHNNTPAILIECGQHNDQTSVDVAYHAILGTLIHLDIIDGSASEKIDHEFLIVRSALYREDKQNLVFPLMEKDYIHVGDPVFETEHGDIIHAHNSGLLFMRNENTPVGEEYAYVCDVYDDWP